MKKLVSISESEWVVMKIIWADSPRTLPEILHALRHTDWSTTTIQTYLARLVKKGALFTERQGKGYLYSSALSEADCQIAEGRSFLNRVYNGSLAQMVRGFVKSGSLSAEELRELKDLIEEQGERERQEEQGTRGRQEEQERQGKQEGTDGGGL